MFLHLLNEAQKQCYYSVAHFILCADGVVEERERRLMESARLEMGLTEVPPTITGISMLPQVLSVFTTPLSRRVVLIEATAAALANEVLHEKEREILDAIAESFGVPTQNVDEYIDYARRIAVITEEGWQLVMAE